MTNTNLVEPRFQNADKAREYLEALHWPHGPVCPHCGSGDDQKRLKGKAHRPGLVQCNSCRQQYTVTVGTVFERSKVPLNKWLLATHLMCASKKGMSAHQLHRMLGVTYKTAWFMAHRIREAMTEDSGPMGGPGSSVEADETYFGKDKTKPESRMAIRNMNRIVSLVDRTTGRSCSVVFNGTFTANDIGPYLFSKIDRQSRLLTDENKAYIRPGREFAKHVTVNHSADEWVSTRDRTAHTNTVEGFFGIFKRGMRGIYQHCGQQHLHRYLAEFDFRYSNRSALVVEDRERADIALKGIAGKRLTYRRIGEALAA